MKLEARNDDCHLRKIDNCIEIIEKIAKNKNTIDTLKTEDGINKICAASNQTAQCLNASFRKCGSPTHQELFKYFNDYFINSLNNFCKNQELKDNFLKNAQCIVDNVLKKDDYKNKCVNSYLATLDKTKADTETAIKINIACCSYNRWENCMYTLINQTCNINARNSLELFVSKTLGATTKEICNDDSFKFTSKRCTKLYAPPSAKSRGKNSDNPITKYLVNYMGFLFT